LASVNQENQELEANAVTEAKGEKEIGGDVENMYAFSAFAAANAAAKLASWRVW